MILSNKQHGIDVTRDDSVDISVSELRSSFHIFLNSIIREIFKRQLYLVMDG